MAGAFSPDAKMVLTGSENNTARLWRVDTGEPLTPPLEHESWVAAVAFSPDGKTVLTGSVKVASLYQPFFSRVAAGKRMVDEQSLRNRT